MNIKPYTSFLNTDSDAQLVVRINAIIAALTGNPSYVTPTPTLVAIAAALAEFSDALSAAADGGVTLTAVKNAKRAALVSLIRALASYVQVTCNGNYAVLLSSGFPPQKTGHEPIGKLPAPANLKLALGTRSGELDASVKPVFGAAMYNWRVATAANPTVVVQSAQTTAASITFAGLTPGVAYVAQANVVGTAGPSDWTTSAPQMAV